MQLENLSLVWFSPPSTMIQLWSFSIDIMSNQTNHDVLDVVSSSLSQNVMQLWWQQQQQAAYTEQYVQKYKS